MLDDYSIYYRQAVSLEQLANSSYSVFLSGFNLSDRVNLVFDAVRAERKIWIVHEEYGFSFTDLKRARRNEVFEFANGEDEAMSCSRLLDHVAGEDSLECSGKICLDLTGLMRPHAMHLLLRLRRMGLSRFDCIYSEPVSYAQREQTKFSKGGIRETRQVRGFEGAATPDSSEDLLIIGAGYDDQLISEVAQYKDSARKVMVVGFPSLRADMYQQNLLRVARAMEAIGDVPRRWRYFAPANDPFATAGVLSSVSKEQMGRGDGASLYLSPLATKAQALGFALFFSFEGSQWNTSIIFPFSNAYEPETGRGLARIWRYVVEFPDQANT